METSFLKNQNFDILLSRDLTFSIYICKDCSSSIKDYEQLSSSRSVVPKDILNLGYIQVSHGKYPIKITTPIMVCPFGFDKRTNQLTLQFTNVKTNPEMSGFFESIQILEMKQMEYLGLQEDESDLYLSQIRYDKKGKYDPNMLLKIPFVRNGYDVDIRGEGDNSSVSLSVSQLFNFSKLKCDIYIDKIWKYNGKFVCKWKVDKIRIMS